MSKTSPLQWKYSCRSPAGHRVAAWTTMSRNRHPCHILTLVTALRSPMSSRVRLAALGAGVIAVALGLSACGGSSGSTAPKTGGSSTQTSAIQQGGTIKVLEGTSPDSLDPDFSYTTQGNEADAMVYIPLLTYAAENGTAGSKLIPGLATSLPTVSADQLTYTLTLRSGLKYSDGPAIQWGGSSFFSGYIKGGTAYLNKKATTISGIQTDDATGKITIQLSQPYGAFDNLLAFESAAPIPSTTPLNKVLSNTPPVGIGPYKFGQIVPNASYQLVKNPNFAAFNIPGIPTGYADTINVDKESNSNTEAQQVLNNQADVFDAGDTVPAQSLGQIQSQAAGRFQYVTGASTYYFFMNTKVAPFNNVAARQAVNIALDRTALAKLSSGALTPGCNFLPPTIVGHADTCVFGTKSGSPSTADVAKAKQMVKAAGLDGTSVTVWSETRSPRQEYCTYLNQLLNELGFKSSLKVIQDSVYFQTIGNQSLNAQVGFADWSQDFPNPSDFYLLLSKAGIQATNNENFGNVDDPKIESQLAPLIKSPASQLQSQAAGWTALDNYVAQQAYTATYGYEQFPKFLSNKIDYNRAIFNPVFYIMFSTLALKK